MHYFPGTLSLLSFILWFVNVANLNSLTLKIYFNKMNMNYIVNINTRTTNKQHVAQI